MLKSQKKAAQISEENGLQCDLAFRLLHTFSELGEIAGEYTKCTHFGRKKFFLTEEFKKEFGDFMYLVLLLAQETGLDIDEVIEIGLARFRKKFPLKD